jgi:hypothetical protein
MGAVPGAVMGRTAAAAAADDAQQLEELSELEERVGALEFTVGAVQATLHEISLHEICSELKRLSALITALNSPTHGAMLGGEARDPLHTARVPVMERQLDGLREQLDSLLAVQRATRVMSAAERAEAEHFERQLAILRLEQEQAAVRQQAEYRREAEYRRAAAARLQPGLDPYAAQVGYRQARADLDPTQISRRSPADLDPTRIAPVRGSAAPVNAAPVSAAPAPDQQRQQQETQQLVKAAVLEPLKWPGRGR